VKVARQEVTVKLAHLVWLDKQVHKVALVMQDPKAQLERLAKLSLHQDQPVQKVRQDLKEKKDPLDHQPRKEVAKLVHQAKQVMQETKAQLVKKVPPDQKDRLVNLALTVAAATAHHLVCHLASKRDAMNKQLFIV